MSKLTSMLTTADWESLYHQIGQIVMAEPTIPSGSNRGSIEVLRWLGRAEALIEQVGGVVDHHKFVGLRTTLLTAILTDSESQMRHIRALLYASLAKAELNAPTVAKGAFIPASNPFDALTAIAGVLRECKGSVLIVDPYMDAVALTDFLKMLTEGVPLQLLASSKQKSSGLPEAVERWRAQYADARPIELRFAAPRSLHDRLIMDNVSVWSLSQSFNAIAQRSPAIVQRVGADIAAAKREAFVEIWNNSTPS